LGYSTSVRLLNATAFGGAIDQERLLVARTLPALQWCGSDVQIGPPSAHGKPSDTSWTGRQTYELFRGFFEQVRHTAHTIDNGTAWPSSLAKVMLDYHVGKLVNIRRNARSYRYFVIYVYIHLRDARKNKFMAQSMTSTRLSGSVLRRSPRL